MSSIIKFISSSNCWISLWYSSFSNSCLLLADYTYSASLRFYPLNALFNYAIFQRLFFVSWSFSVRVDTSWPASSELLSLDLSLLSDRETDTWLSLILSTNFWGFGVARILVNYILMTSLILSLNFSKSASILFDLIFYLATSSLASFKVFLSYPYNSSLALRPLWSSAVILFSLAMSFPSISLICICFVCLFRSWTSSSLLLLISTSLSVILNSNSLYLSAWTKLSSNLALSWASRDAIFSSLNLAYFLKRYYFSLVRISVSSYSLIFFLCCVT